MYIYIYTVCREKVGGKTWGGGNGLIYQYDATSMFEATKYCTMQNGKQSNHFEHSAKNEFQIQEENFHNSPDTFTYLIRHLLV